VARPDLSDIDEALKALGTLPKELDRQLAQQLGSTRIDVRRADELLAMLAVATTPTAVQPGERHEPAPDAAHNADDEEDTAVLIDIDPDDDD